MLILTTNRIDLSKYGIIASCNHVEAEQTEQEKSRDHAKQLERSDDGRFSAGCRQKYLVRSALQHDLVCVNEIHQPDPFTFWATKTFLGTFHRFVGRRYKSAVGSEGSTLFHYDEKHLEMPAEILSTALSALLPVAAIVVLYVVQNRRSG